MKSLELFPKKDCEYLNHLSLLFNGAAQGTEKKKIEDAFIIQLISFPHDNELSNPDLDDNVVYILNYLATTLSDLSCVKKQGIEERYHRKNIELGFDFQTKFYPAFFSKCGLLCG